MLNVNQIKVGDKVAFAQFHYGTPIHHGFSVVSKINGYGHITLECGKQFDKFGCERGSGRCSLLEVDTLQTALDNLARQNMVNKNVQGILDLFNSRRNSFGDYHPTQETADALKDLARRIETNTWTE